MQKTLGSGFATTRMPVKRFSVAEYHRLVDAGFVKPDERCELLRGFIVERARMKPPHTTALRNLREAVDKLVGKRLMLDTQVPITLADSELHPDLFLASGTKEDYRERHPGPADLALVVEVSDSTLADDRGEKRLVYAENNIVQYWIVNIPERVVEVYLKPLSGPDPAYRETHVFKPGESMPVMLDGVLIGELKVSEILP